MQDPDRRNVTAALRRAAQGEAGAEESLFGLVYDELRQMARRRLGRMAPGQTLQATALVHEAWLKIADSEEDWADRDRLFRVVARAMRNILVDGARRKASAKRGGGLERLSVGSIASPDRDTTSWELLALDEALTELATLDARAAEVVMLRYFSGLESGVVARMLDVSERTVERDWRFARSWLKERMHGAEDASPEQEGPR